MEQIAAEPLAKPTSVLVPETENKDMSPLGVVIVCGMGPLDLQEMDSSDRLFPTSAYARRNAQAAKILAGEKLADQIIMSGGISNKNEFPDTSESELLADTYDRMRAT